MQIVIRDNLGAPILDSDGECISDWRVYTKGINARVLRAQRSKVATRTTICQDLAPFINLVLRDQNGHPILDGDSECMWDDDSDFGRMNESIEVKAPVTCQPNPVLSKINRSPSPRLCPTDDTILQFGCEPFTTTDGELVYTLIP